MKNRKVLKVGVIGLGNMGGMLTRNFLKRNILMPNKSILQIIISQIPNSGGNVSWC